MMLTKDAEATGGVRETVLRLWVHPSGGWAMGSPMCGEGVGLGGRDLEGILLNSFGESSLEE